MKEYISKLNLRLNSKLKGWAEERIFGVFVFTNVLFLLVLLYSAGYFAPYVPLTINLIIVIAIILSIILLQLHSKFIFSLAILFWLLTSLFMVFDIDVWAERAAIYAFEALVIGIILLIIEINILAKNE